MGNEDKAVGVWVDRARLAGLSVRSIQLHNRTLTDHIEVANICLQTLKQPERWRQNDMVLAHKVTMQQMRCFSRQVNVRTDSDCECNYSERYWRRKRRAWGNRNDMGFWTKEHCAGPDASVWCEELR